MANFTQTYFDFSFLITSFCPIQGFSLFPNLEFNHKIVAVTGRASLRWRMSAILTLQRQRQEDVEFDPCLSCIWRKHIRVIQVSGSPRCEVSLVFNLYLCAPLLFPAAPLTSLFVLLLSPRSALCCGWEFKLSTGSRTVEETCVCQNIASHLLPIPFPFSSFCSSHPFFLCPCPSLPHLFLLSLTSSCTNPQWSPCPLYRLEFSIWKGPG